jgi:hypothetical protein
MGGIDPLATTGRWWLASPATALPSGTNRRRVHAVAPLSDIPLWTGQR